MERATIVCGLVNKFTTVRGLPMAPADKLNMGPGPPNRWVNKFTTTWWHVSSWVNMFTMVPRR